MMKRKTAGPFLLMCTTLFSLSLSTDTSAADVTKLVESCINCHGKDGASTESDIPILGGVSAQYIIDSMAAYKKKARPCPETKYHAGGKKGQKTDMCQIAKDLSDADVKELAKHFAGKKFVRAQQKTDAALVKKGKELHDRRCEKCHSEGGSVAADDGGILAGQWMPYLRDTFKDYGAGKRPMPEKMKPKMQNLGKEDTEALVHYYGSFK